MALNWAQLTPRMVEVLTSPEYRVPRLFAPDQYDGEGHATGEYLPGHWLDRRQAKELRRLYAEEGIVMPDAEHVDFLLDTAAPPVVELMGGSETDNDDEGDNDVQF